MRLFDTHCHLHDAGRFPEPEAVLERARAAGVERINVVGTHPADWPVAVAFAERWPGVTALVGWHPNYCAEYDAASLPRLREWLNHPKVVGLGEMGLDRHWDYAPFDLQRAALRDQLELAREGAWPLVFHVREAMDEFIPILQARGSDRYVVHCFTGTRDEAEALTPLGVHFGLDGPVTYRRAEALREAVRAIPVHRILLETDAPYLSPEPHRGKPNEPGYVPLILAGVARARGETAAEVAAAAWASSVELFG